MSPAEKLIARRIIELRTEGYSSIEACTHVSNLLGLPTARVERVLDLIKIKVKAVE